MWAHAHRTSSHGGFRCQDSMVSWPGGLLCVAGLGVGLLWPGFPSQLPSFGSAAPVWGQAGAPAAVAPVRARARTNELDASKRWPMIEGEEQPASWLWLPGQGVCWGGGFRSCVAWRSGSHSHPFGRPRGAGAMTMPSGGPGCSVSSSSAARPGSGCSSSSPGPGDPPPGLSPRRRLGRGRLWGWSVFGFGEQVPGAGEQLAGDRGGGDLLPAPFGDGLVAGGELR
jgi:hypothetical protein